MQATIRAAILVLSTACTALAQGADLTIRVDNVKSAGGQVKAALYDSAGNFLKQPAQQAAVPASQGSTTVVFRDLAPGEYGFAVYHDANGNGKMDANAMGIPIEPVAFSNNAQGFMGPPAFDAVKFALPAAGAAVDVKLR
jgi:uncharacterized protein (DUF2141 family)